MAQRITLSAAARNVQGTFLVSIVHSPHALNPDFRNGEHMITVTLVLTCGHAHSA